MRSIRIRLRAPLAAALLLAAPTLLRAQEIRAPQLRPLAGTAIDVVPTLREFVRGLPVHPGVDAELARYDRGALSPDYRRAFAQIARARLLDAAEGIALEIRNQGCRPRTEVAFPGSGFTGRSDTDKAARGFEGSLVFSRLVACFPGARGPRGVLALYVSPEVRMGAQSRLEEVFQQDGLTCYRVGGVPVLLSPSLACNDVHLRSGPVAAEHSQSVFSEVDGKQPVYFKESLKVAFATDQGVALVHLNLSRTTGLNGLEKRVGRGAIEDTLERQAALVAEALSRGR